jgi:nucleotide-binding universal stress UspA family protein
MSASVAVHAIRRIAHPTDFSIASRNALTWAIYLARQHQAELLLLNVVPPPTPIFEGESCMKSGAERALSALLARLETIDIAARGFLLTGNSSIDSQIIRAAELEHVDLIIMGTRGRSGLSRLFAGSLASRVVSRAHCPVLVVPGRSSRPDAESRPKNSHHAS